MLSKFAVLAVPLVSGIALIAALRPEQGPATNPAGYRDDSLTIPASARTLKVGGDMGIKPYKLPTQQGDGRLFLDLRSARFTLANSRNANPTPENPCDKGDLPINKNPLRVAATADVTIVGGLILGSVPQDTDWRSTYCNSTAVDFWDAPNGEVDGVRVSQAWDGIRIGRAAGTFQVRNSWLSNVRDDAIENDRLHSGSVEDSLIDGALQGMAMRPNAKSKIGPTAGLVEISGSLIRLKEHRSADGRWSLGSLIKNDPRAPRIKLTNNVIALDADRIDHWSDSWEVTWGKLSGASNNLVLWLSDRPMPPGWNLPPQGFRMIRGAPARAAWAAAKRNWIDCHPRLARLPGDPRSNFERCRPGTWGGY